MPSVAEETVVPAKGQAADQAGEGEQPAAELPSIAEQPAEDSGGNISAAPARRTRRQTMAHATGFGHSRPTKGHLQHISEEKPAEKQGSAEVQACELLQSLLPRGAVAGAVEEATAVLGNATDAARSGMDVPEDSRAERPVPDAQQVTGGAPPRAPDAEPAAAGAAPVVWMMRQQTKATLAMPAGLGRSLLDAAAGRPRSGKLAAMLLPAPPEELGAQPPLPSSGAAFIEPETAPTLTAASAPTELQAVPGCATRRRTMAPALKSAAAIGGAACQAPSASVSAKGPRGRKRKSSHEEQVSEKQAGLETRAIEQLLSGRELPADDACLEAAAVAPLSSSKTVEPKVQIVSDVMLTSPNRNLHS